MRFANSKKQFFQKKKHGRIVEQASIYAEYFDNEDDQYDENSTFTYNGQNITMQEYEAYMDTYKYVDPDVMEKAEFDVTLSTNVPATDYNLYEEYRTIVQRNYQMEPEICAVIHG